MLFGLHALSVKIASFCSSTLSEIDVYAVGAHAMIMDDLAWYTCISWVQTENWYGIHMYISVY